MREESPGRHSLVGLVFMDGGSRGKKIRLSNLTRTESFTVLDFMHILRFSLDGIKFNLSIS